MATSSNSYWTQIIKSSQDGILNASTSSGRNLGAPPDYPTEQQLNPDNSMHETPFQRGQQASKRGRDEMEAEDKDASAAVVQRPKKAKKTAATKTSANSALESNPPSAQTAQKRSINSVEFNAEEPALPQAKRQRSTMDAGVSFGADPPEVVEPQLQVVEPKHHVVMPELVVQPDVPLPFSISDVFMQWKNMTDCTIPTVDDISIYDPPLTSENGSPVQQDRYNPFVKDEQLFPDPLPDIVSSPFDVEDFDHLLKHQGFGLKDT